MAKYTVGATPQKVNLPSSATPLIQNLGPETVYFDNADDPVAGGARLQAGDAYEYPVDLHTAGGSGLWLAAETEGNDVRVIQVG